jgi:CRP-like cAMP-binding protein
MECGSSDKVGAEETAMLSLLKESQLFTDCTAEVLKRVAAACEVVTFAAGQTVFEAASPAEYMYIVSDGCVELRFTVTSYAESREIPIDRLFKGDVIGWSAIVAPHIFTLSGVAVRDSTLLRIQGSSIRPLCVEDNHFGHVFMRNLTNLIGQRFNTVQRMLIGTVQDALKKKEPGG